MSEPDPIFRTGDLVWTTHCGMTLPAKVVLASKNGKSLMLSFEAIIGGYVGAMPVSWNETRGEYEDLIEQACVVVTPYPS
jgi:hypothetical protein